MTAQIVPAGWRCSDRIKAKAERILPRFEDVIWAETEKVRRVPGMDHESLLQEGRLLATYAIATWKKRGGKSRRGWVGLVVRHGLLAIVNYEKALKRAPREPLAGKDRKLARRRDRRLAEFQASDTIEQTARAQPTMAAHEILESSSVVQQVLDGLCEEDRSVLLLHLSPPPELIVAARNTKPRRTMITDRLVADYLDVPLAHVKRAMENAKALWRAIDASV